MTQFLSMIMVRLVHLSQNSLLYTRQSLKFRKSPIKISKSTELRAKMIATKGLASHRMLVRAFLTSSAELDAWVKLQGTIH